MEKASTDSGTVDIKDFSARNTLADSDGHRV
jgi:hypothetical protein